MSGVETIRRLSVLAPASRILVLTGSEDPHGVVEAILAGACGYMLKSAPPAELIGAVRSCAAGDSVISPQVAGFLLERIRERDIPVTVRSEHSAAAIRSVLTERELEIFKLLASGESNPEIGRELSLSENTVKNSPSSSSTTGSKRRFRRFGAASPEVPAARVQTEAWLSQTFGGPEWQPGLPTWPSLLNLEVSAGAAAASRHRSERSRT
jgi:FixJ family two-component response regulator